MRTAAICPTCATYENAVCVIYNGDTLYNINVPPLTDLQSALGLIDSSIGSVTALINSVAANPFFLTTEGTTNLATLTGNVLNIPTYEPTLQEVITYGNTTDQDIVIANSAGTSSLTVAANHVEIKNITTDYYTFLTHTHLYLYNTLGASYINLPNPNDNATFNFQSVGGTLALTTDCTLQNITSGTNKDLVGGINLQGTGAGDNNTGTQDINAFGFDAAKNNTGAIINALGRRAAEDNTGGNVNVFGTDSANNNSGDFVNGIGGISLYNNSGSYVNAMGPSAGANNTYSYVNLLGYGASASANNQLVLSKNTGTYMARIGYGGITADRLYTLPNASGELVVSVNSIVPVNGNVTVPVGLPYLVYTAIVTLTGGGPTVVELQNTLGATITWADTSGAYTATASSSVFTSGKTWVQSANYFGSALVFNFYGVRTSGTVVTYRSHRTDDNSSSAAFSAPIFVEIRVYP